MPLPPHFQRSPEVSFKPPPKKNPTDSQCLNLLSVHTGVVKISLKSSPRALIMRPFLLQCLRINPNPPLSSDSRRIQECGFRKNSSRTGWTRNEIAEALSQFQMSRFRRAFPRADSVMTPFPLLHQVWQTTRYSACYMPP